MTDSASTDAVRGTDTNGLMADPPITSQIPEFADWLPAFLRPYWDSLAQYPIVGAVLIAVIFCVAAFVIRGVVVRTIARFAAKTETDLDNRALDGLRKPVFNVVLLVGLVLAIKALQLPAGTELLVNILLSIIAVTVMRAALFLGNVLLDALSRNHHRFSAIEERTIPLFDLIAKLLIILFGSYGLLMIWGINPVGWLASAGIVGLAVGFAAKDTLANLFAGFFVLVDTPYKLGDYINLDTGERGQVTHIGMRSTRMLTRDDVEITIPNSVMGNAKIVNESGGQDEKMRIRIAVGVAYGSDVHAVVDLLEDLAIKNSDVCMTPTPRVRMRAFGESSLDFELLAWIDKPEDRGRISHDLYMEIYASFNESNIEIPYAKRDLYIKEMPRV